MSNTQVTDNIMFVAALQQLARLAERKGLTAAECELVKRDLERIQGPTIIVPCEPV